MKIALTGSSSTGKTTLAKELMNVPEFRIYFDEFLTTDARSILRGMNHQSMDKMTLDERRAFQRDYFDRKMRGEMGKDRFITDRSFVDVAAYWLRRDTRDAAPNVRAELEEPCRREAYRYALHVYCPLDILPFEADGYRSADQDLHREVDVQIVKSLKEWGLRIITLDTASPTDRIERVLREVRRMNES